MPIQLVEKLNVEVDSWELLEQYLQVAIPTCLSSTDELALKILSYNEEGKPDIFFAYQDSFPVLLIGGGRIPEAGKPPNSYFQGHEPWRIFNNLHGRGLKYMLAITKAELLHGHPECYQAFRQHRGDGYSNSFIHSDGDVVIGFQLRTGGTFPQYLAICLTHIYYGK